MFSQTLNGPFVSSTGVKWDDKHYLLKRTSTLNYVKPRTRKRN